MILNKQGESFWHKGKEYRVGEWVVGNEKSEYQGLYGKITQICVDKEMENQFPNIYCIFECPVLPCEMQEVEKRFSDLYGEPKTMHDIVCGTVKITPDKITLLEDLEKCRQHPVVYVLFEDWAIDAERGNSFEIYSDYDDAKRMLINKLRDEQEKECIVLMWHDHEKFFESSTSNYYVCYLEGEYERNHYVLFIEPHQLCVSDNLVKILSDVGSKNLDLEEFISQAADLEGVDRLTDEQYDKMVHDARFSKKLQEALGSNERYWKAYWDTFANVAYEFVTSYLNENTHIAGKGMDGRNSESI